MILRLSPHYPKTDIADRRPGSTAERAEGFAGSGDGLAAHGTILRCRSLC